MQLLEAKDNLQRMLIAIPLNDDERAAVEDGQRGLDNLLDRLLDVLTPTGTTPRESRFRRPRPCFRSFPSTRADENVFDNSDST